MGVMVKNKVARFFIMDHGVYCKNIYFTLKRQIRECTIYTKHYIIAK